VTDGDSNDADTDAGQIQLNNMLLGTYTVTETVAPSGWELDPDSTRVVTVDGTSELNAVIGTQGTNDAGTTEESDFHNYQLGSIHGYKFEDLNGNGDIDGGELGMPSITITLIGDVDGDGDLDTLTTTTTDGSTDANNDGVINGDDVGFFIFDDLEPGVYVLEESFTDGTEWGATVDHDGDGIGDAISTVTIGSGDELVAFQSIADLDSGQQEVLAGDAVIFGNMPLGGCGLSPGFWAQHLYIWDGEVGAGGVNGPPNNPNHADVLVPDVVSDNDILHLFPQQLHVDDDGTFDKPELVFEGSGGQFLVIEWDDAQELINASLTTPSKLADIARMGINAFLNTLGVDGFNADGILTDFADWMIGISGATTEWSTDSNYHILKYNNLSEPNNGGSSAQDGPKDGFSVNMKGNSPAMTAWRTGDPSGQEIFDALAATICQDESGNPEIQGSADGSLLVLGVHIQDNVLGVIDTSLNQPDGIWQF